MACTILVMGVLVLKCISAVPAATVPGPLMLPSLHNTRVEYVISKPKRSTKSLTVINKACGHRLGFKSEHVLKILLNKDEF